MGENPRRKYFGEKPNTCLLFTNLIVSYLFQKAIFEKILGDFMASRSAEISKERKTIELQNLLEPFGNSNALIPVKKLRSFCHGNNEKEELYANRETKNVQ